MVYSMSFAQRFCTTRISVSAPAFSNARFVSISQLVPGNTGMNTFGFATRMTGEPVYLWLSSGTSYSTATVSALFAKIFSSLPFQVSMRSSKSSALPFSSIFAVSVTVPSTTASNVFLTLSSASAGTSTTSAPAFGAKSSSAFSAVFSNLKPSLLPNAIFATAAAAPPSLTTCAERTEPSAIFASTFL